MGHVQVKVVCNGWLVIACSQVHCMCVWCMWQKILWALRFAFVGHKNIGQCMSLTWLMLGLDSSQMTGRLPRGSSGAPEKVAKAIGL